MIIGNIREKIYKILQDLDIEMTFWLRLHRTRNSTITYTLDSKKLRCPAKNQLPCWRDWSNGCEKIQSSFACYKEQYPEYVKYFKIKLKKEK
jgi:hypothetical protein